MNLEDRIKEAWAERCKTLVPCHNPDIILRVSMQAFLQEMVQTGVIQNWKDIDVRMVQHLDHLVGALSVTVQPTRSLSFIVLETVFMGLPTPPPPRNPDERFNFDD